jgi:hypothetical protein
LSDITIAQQCVACAADCHSECMTSPVGSLCCCAQLNAETITVLDWADSDPTRYGGFKGKQESIDPKSTGRKRAAKLYPIQNGMPCEWRGLKSAGGGASIVGCESGVALHRHHGPNKDTLHNEPGNVHRICTPCHNRWHARNDPSYNWEGPWEPHDPNTKATEQEMAAAEIYWASNKPKKAKDE